MRQMMRRGAARAGRADPAPSRLSYRLQRLALTPTVRRAVTVGLPILAVSIIAGSWLADEARRDAATAWAGELRRSIESREEFMVRLMAIDGATDTVSQDIRAALSLRFPVSSFDLDLPAMRDSIQALDAVESASLRVRPGGVLDVAVVERVPQLVWRDVEGLHLLDRDGQRVAGIETRADRPDLPLISGLGADAAADEALRLIAAADPLTSRLRGLVRIGERRWDLILSDGQKIKLPAERPVAALEQVLAVDAAQELFARDVVLVDMRVPRRPTVRLSPDASRDLRQVKLLELGDD